MNLNTKAKAPHSYAAIDPTPSIVQRPPHKTGLKYDLPGESVDKT
jgi:hypothetical protein